MGTAASVAVRVRLCLYFDLTHKCRCMRVAVPVLYEYNVSSTLPRSTLRAAGQLAGETLWSVAIRGRYNAGRYLTLP